MVRDLGADDDRLPAPRRRTDPRGDPQGQRGRSEDDRPCRHGSGISRVARPHRAVRLRRWRIQHLSVRSRPVMDRGHQLQLSHRCGWDLTAPPGALHVRDGAVGDLLLEPLGRAEEPKGLPHPDADPGYGHERDFCGSRPGPLLHLLRSGPVADVLHDRHLGRQVPEEGAGLQPGLRDEALRRDQVFPVHAVRFGLHAAGLSRPVFRVRQLR